MTLWHYALIAGCGVLVLAILAAKWLVGWLAYYTADAGPDTGLETHTDIRHRTTITRGDDIASI